VVGYTLRKGEDTMIFLFVKESCRGYRNDCNVWLYRDSLMFEDFIHFDKEVL